MKKKGLIKKDSNTKRIVFFNNPNWDIVTNMIHGISKSISIISSDKYSVLSKIDFKIKNLIELKCVSSRMFSKCNFTDFCPYVFENIRREFGISDESYLESIGIKTFQNAFFDKLSLMLSESSSGKSGSFFFHSSDGQFMIKTIKKPEFYLLMKTLPNYYNYIKNHPRTLISRYYGLHQLKCYNDSSLVYDIYICIMNNVFNLENPEKIQSIYDLKGSSYKRKTPEENIDKGQAKKDLNFIAENQTISI